MDSFWGNIFKQQQTPGGTRALLKGIPIFERLQGREIEAVERILYRREYAPGEVIFRQGEPGVGMYLVQRGTVAIRFETTGEVLTQLGEGDFFGEIALLNETPRSASAVAVTPCVLWGLFQPELLDLLDRNPRLGVKLLLPLAQIAGRRLIRTDEYVQELRRSIDRLTADAAEAAAPTDGAPSISVD